MSEPANLPAPDDVHGATIIGVVGAESTGKSTLAKDLAEALRSTTSLRVACVPEWLRTWCDLNERTPRRDEQLGIACTQAEHIAEAAAQHEVVVCDTTPLMTGIYSELIFDDDSLRAPVCEWHRRYVDLTLLMSLDLPWVADGLQRDGPHVRAPVDDLLRRWLMSAGVDFTIVSGTGDARLAAALDAVTTHLRPRASRAGGLFTRLQDRHAGTSREWICIDCDDPDCEHRLKSAGIAEGRTSLD